MPADAGGPVPAGVKVTSIAQLAPTASEAPQVVVSANWPASPPLTAMLEIVRVAEPVFVTPIDRKELELPAGWSPNDNEAADRVATAALGRTPDPETSTTCGRADASSENDSAATREPVAVGANVTVAEQLEPGCRIDAQLFVWAKSDA